MSLGTITVDDKPYECQLVEPGYSTPKATKLLDMALKQEASPEPKMVEKLFEKAVAAEIAGLQVFATAKEAKAAGWFSRRNQTDEAHKAHQLWLRERQAQKEIRASI